MARKVFVNLPVADLPASMAFYEAIGARNEPTFTDDTAACMVFSDTIYVMLLTHDKFAQFTSKRIVDAHESTEVLVAVSCDGRDEVDDMVERAVAAGGREARPAKDHGFMYERAFEDPDGHVWEPHWMDMAAARGALAEQPA